MISINLSELIWTVINFFLLYVLLNRFLYQPIRSFMRQRQDRVDAGLAQERDAASQVKENQQRLEAEKAESREEAKRILRDASDRAARRREETVSQARQDADAARGREEDLAAARLAEENARLAEAKPDLARLLVQRLLDQGQE